MTGSSSLIAETRSPLASYGLEGTTTFRPETCAKNDSALWEWYGPPLIPPPYGALTTTGAEYSPPDLYLIFESSEII